MPPVEIVNCTCTAASVRQNAHGGQPLATLAGRRDGGGRAALTDTGFTLTFSGALQGTDVDAAHGSADGAVTETVKGTAGGAAAGRDGHRRRLRRRRRAGRHRVPGHVRRPGSRTLDVGALELVDFNGASGFVGETARGGPIDNKGHIVEATGNHAPAVETAAGPYTIPIRTPFALTGSATDFDGDTVTYMWEQNDRGGIRGGRSAPAANNVKTNGPLFRQFGKAVDISPTDTLQSPSPGLNGVDTNPTRVFPDMAQILANNTNAVSGTCPPGPPPPTAARRSRSASASRSSCRPPTTSASSSDRTMNVPAHRA